MRVVGLPGHRHNRGAQALAQAGDVPDGHLQAIGFARICTHLAQRCSRIVSSMLLSADAKHQNLGVSDTSGRPQVGRKLTIRSSWDYGVFTS
jgi:hypothetical protein